MLIITPLSSSQQLDGLHNQERQHSHGSHQYPVFDRQRGDLEDRRSRRDHEHGHLHGTRKKKGPQKCSIRCETITIGWPTIISVQAIAIAFVFSVIAGIFFGLYPANKASKMNPIEALHDE